MPLFQSVCFETLHCCYCSTGLISKFAVAANTNALLNLHTHTIVIIIHFISIIALALVAAWQVYTDGVGGARFVFLAFIYICVERKKIYGCCRKIRKKASVRGSKALSNNQENERYEK